MLTRCNFHVHSAYSAHKDLQAETTPRPENEHLESRQEVAGEDGNLSAYYKSGKRRDVQKCTVQSFSSPQDDFAIAIF